MTTKLAGKGTVFLPFNRGNARRRGQPRPPERLPDGATCGRRSGSGTASSTSSPASSTSSRGEEADRRQEDEGERHLPPLPPAGRRPEAGGDGARRRCRPQLPGPALRRLGQEQHHRVAGSPALQPARRATTSGLRLGRRHHRPARCSTGSSRTRSTSSSTSRASSQKIDENSPQLAEALDGGHADHHHDAPEVPFVAEKIGRAPEPALRRHRGRGPLARQTGEAARATSRRCSARQTPRGGRGARTRATPTARRTTR